MIDKLIFRVRSSIGNAVRTAVSGELSSLRDEVAKLRIELRDVRQAVATSAAHASARVEAVTRRIDHASPLLWNDLRRPLESPLPSPHDLANGANVVADIEAIVASMEDTPQYKCVSDVGSIQERLGRDTWPLPSPGDREGYFEDRDLAYAVSGVLDAAFVSDVAARHGAAMGSHSTLLDFGCASGRVLRAIRTLHPDVALIGVDLNLHNIRWARQYLEDAALFVQGTTLPTIPLESDTVDVLYAGSVFTHISDFEEAWLLEIRRILRPDGIAIVTVHPERLWSEMGHPDNSLTALLLSSTQRIDPPGVLFESLDLFAHRMPGPRVVFTTIDWPVNNTNVIHSDEWIQHRWSRVFEVEERIAHAHGHHQDAIVVRKRRAPT